MSTARPPMPLQEAAYEIDGRHCTAAQFYAMACDPRRSVAIEACAGAGKTWMLVSRIVRALLAGADPGSILAITFTKKAAAEMRTRLDEWLREFETLDEDACAQALVQRGLAATEAKTQAQALKALRQKVLTQGQTVQIRTFHSWFAALLRSAPLALLQGLGLPTRYTLLEDEQMAYAALWPRFWQRLDTDAALGQDHQRLVAEFGRSSTQTALVSALALRTEFERADAHGVIERSVPTAQAWDPSLFAADASWPDLLVSASETQRWSAWAQALGHEDKTTPRNAAQTIEQALQEFEPLRRLQALRSALFVKDEDRLKRWLPGNPVAQEASEHLQRLLAARAQDEAQRYQLCMARLTRALLQEYATCKREQAWIDMSDVERAAHRMLTDEALAGWVQERLDWRIRHLLIDEFQDTNPLQWQIVSTWLSAYAGAVDRAPVVLLVGDPKQSIYRFRRAEPQVFVAAKAFVRETLQGVVLACDHTRRNAQRVVQAVNAVMLQAQAGQLYSGYRAHTTESQEPGLVAALPAIERTAAAAGPEDDAANPAQTDSNVDATPLAHWRDSLTEPPKEPEQASSEREAAQLANWIAEQQHAAREQGQPPASIMVLARKGHRLPPLRQALRERGIAHTMTDKTLLHAAAPVQDVLALVDALLHPDHDLSLARALKSPIWAWSDADLAELALAVQQQRAQAVQSQKSAAALSWRDVLHRLCAPAGALLDSVDSLDSVADSGPQTQGPIPAHWCTVSEQLLHWQRLFQTLPPHDALHRVFAEQNLIERFAARACESLRSLTVARLESLLHSALHTEGGRYLTPLLWLRSIRHSSNKTPQQSDASGEASSDAPGDASNDWVADDALPDASGNEAGTLMTTPLSGSGQTSEPPVQLLTIHSAKGLEADTVVLLDTQAQAPRARRMTVLVDWPGQSPAPTHWVFLQSEKTPPPCAAQLMQTERSERAREEMNTLYVAMTRARQQLLFSSVAPRERKKPSTDSPAPLSWHAQLHAAYPDTEAIALKAHPAPPPAPAPETAPETAPEPGTRATPATATPAPVFEIRRLPVWAGAARSTSPTPESADARTRPQAQAQTGDAHEELQETTSPLVDAQAQAHTSWAQRWGVLVHALLEHSPNPTEPAQSPARRSEALHALAAQWAHTLALSEYDQTSALTLAERMRQGEAAWLWDAAQLLWQGNEVPIVFEGQSLRIDRLVQTQAGDWWVLDYKTAVHPERQAALRAQLQRYQQAVQMQLPEARVRIAFITAEGRLIEMEGTGEREKKGEFDEP